jgi:replicative DNA helicase
MYWVHQKSGYDYRVNGAHILALLETRRPGEIVPIETTVDALIQRPIWYQSKVVHGYKVPVDFPAQAVKLPPYFLGYWLGDGNSSSGTIFTEDQEVIAYLQSYAESIGKHLRAESDKPGGKVFKCCISNGRGGGVHRRGDDPGWILGEMGLLRDWQDAQGKSVKHIPPEYIANSRQVRLELLAGLLDSDGSLSHCGYEITQKNEVLARQIKYLADSLGFKTHITTKSATIKNRAFVGQVWRVHIYGDVEQIPVLIQRKKAAPRKINKDWRVTGITIEKDTVDDYFGFTLDGDGLFLLGDMTVTHNTTYAECIAEHWARQGQHVVFVHFELSKIIMLDRRACRHTSIARRTLKYAHELTPAELRTLGAAAARLQQWPGEITYLHTPGKTIELVLRELTGLHSAGKCDVAVIDYLEKASASTAQLKSYGSNIFAREAHDVELLKSWAENDDHPTPLLVLSQFSKAGKNVSFKDLDRTDIRGAGEKTEKANMVVLLHPNKDNPGVVDVRIDKNTMGPKGTFTQYLDGPAFSVGDVTP